jgi:AcrR family transcriptional regulator
MARPVSIDDDTILRAAREVFMELGYAATTQQIATRAGVSSGSIFKRFPSKEELFWQCMQYRDTEEVAMMERMASLAGDRSVPENLTELLSRMILVLTHEMPSIMMAWSNLPPDFLATKFDGEGHPSRHIEELLEAYLTTEMNDGRMARADAHTLTQVIMGTAFHYVFMNMTAGGSRRPSATDPAWIDQVESYAANFIQLMWTGLTPPA